MIFGEILFGLKVFKFQLTLVTFKGYAAQYHSVALNSYQSSAPIQAKHISNNSYSIFTRSSIMGKYLKINYKTLTIAVLICRF